MVLEIEAYTKDASSEAVKALRKETGLTQKAFAEKYGVPQRTLQEWESGRRKPPAYVFRMLAMYVKYYDMMENK